MKKLKKMERELNDKFREDLASEFLKKFGLEIETGYNFLQNTIYSKRVDGLDFTPEQLAYFTAYESGYLTAMIRVRKAAEMEESK